MPLPSIPYNNRPDLLYAGPVLQSKSRLRQNEYGRLEQDRTYLIFDYQYPLYTSPFDIGAIFTWGDSPPEGPINFLYLQSHQFTAGGKAPGVGVVECHYVGASLLGSSEFATSSPFFRDHLTLSQVEVFLYSGDATAGYQITGTAQIEYYGIDQEFHYMSRALIASPTYLIEPYPQDSLDERHPQPTIRSIIATTNAGVPIAAPSLIFPDNTNPVMETFMTLSDLPREPLRPSYLDVGGVSEGLWDIAEHFAIRIRPVIPANLLGFAP